jgi:2-polyprenyl-6-methoxyphenol hydroxylase-like FAD-dependent oxidoreductase
MLRDDDADIIICGGGIAGLGLACALARFDVRVLLLEKRSGPGGIHRGDSLLPRTTRLFREWGVLDAIVAAGAEPIDRLEVHDPRRGKACETPLTAPGDDPYLVLPHARIEETLERCAVESGRVRLVRGAKVTDVVFEDDRARGARWEVDHEPFEARARLIVGTDGHRSVVRERLGIAAVARRYDHAYLGLEADRPAAYENAMRVHLHEEGGCLLMPRPDRVGIGMLVEAGSGPRWIGMSDDELRAMVVARAPILAGAAIHRRGAHVYELARAHALRYHARGAVILGDAAHVTNPSAGQGMTMALGDAGLLASLVGPAFERGARDLEPALRAFEAEQWPRNERLIKGSHRLAVLYAARGRLLTGLKLAAARALASPALRGITARVIASFLTDSTVRDARAVEPALAVR